MKKLSLVVLAVLLAYPVVRFLGVDRQQPPSPAVPSSADTTNRSEPRVHFSHDDVERAFASQRSNVQVTVLGVVRKVLADDDDGSRHQRFLVELDSGHTVLVAHNIDLAPRVVALATGDPITVRGEYEWNAKGGVIHWTHRDPQGKHEAGWIEHGGRTYQ